jgi:hypothetical protein
MYVYSIQLYVYGVHIGYYGQLNYGLRTGIPTTKLGPTPRLPDKSHYVSQGFVLGFFYLEEAKFIALI